MRIILFFCLSVLLLNCEDTQSKKKNEQTNNQPKKEEKKAENKDQKSNAKPKFPVLTDKNAMEFFLEYEKNNKIAKPVYIAAVTASTFTEDRQKCLEVGMNNFISKPFNIAELKKIIRNAIRN